MPVGKIFIIIGIAFVAIGVLLTLNLRIPWLGKLPGDIVIEKENMRFYFPLATCLLISILLTALFYFIKK